MVEAIAIVLTQLRESKDLSSKPFSNKKDVVVVILEYTHPQSHWTGRDAHIQPLPGLLTSAFMLSNGHTAS